MTARRAAVEALLRAALAAVERLACEERDAIRRQLIAFLDQDGAAEMPRARKLARGDRGGR